MRPEPRCDLLACVGRTWWRSQRYQANPIQNQYRHYILDHMDLEWEDQFKDLDLKMKPSDYWRRQCYATYQSDRVGIKLLDEIGEDNIMWGSDFPHPDGIWPDSQEYIQRELGHLPAATRHKIVCGNAARLYGFAA